MSVRFRPERNKWEASFVLRGRRIRVLRELKKDAIEFEKDAKKKGLGLEDVAPSLEISEAFKMYFAEESNGKESFLNDRNYFNLAHHFLIEVRGLRFLNDISLQDLEALQKWLLPEQTLSEEPRQVKEPWKASTVNRAFHTYNHLFKKMCAWGKLEKSPAQFIERLPEQPVRRVPLTREIFESLHKHPDAPDWWKDVLEFMYALGARGSSVKRLDWANVNLADRWLEIDTRKGAKAVPKIIRLPILDNVFALLVRVRNKWPEATGPVFRYDDGRGPIRGDLISKWGTKLLKRGGHEGVVLYGSRHGLASDLIDNGVEIEIVRQLLGHSSTATTQIYTKNTKLQTLSRGLGLVRGQETPPDATSEKLKTAVGSRDSE